MPLEVLGDGTARLFSRTDWLTASLSLWTAMSLNLHPVDPVIVGSNTWGSATSMKSVDQRS